MAGMDDKSNVLARAAGGAPAKYSRAALASFVCGVASILGLLLAQLAPGLVYLVLLFLPAILLGHAARRRFRKAPGQYRNESMATFGLAVGYLGLFLNAFVLMAMVLLGAR
jgi:hypothetical protein